MSSILKADDRLTIDLPSAPAKYRHQRRITWGFNLALFAFHGATGILSFLFLSGKAQGIPTSGLFWTSTLDLLRFAVVTLITAAFVLGFWRRFVSTISSIRPINYAEAVAIILMVSLLFGH